MAFQIDLIEKRFRKVEQLIQQKTWFKNEKWTISIHVFPNKTNPEGITLHVSKKHWWNQDRQGIHIESYLALDPKKHKKTYVTLHVLHLKIIPGTKLKREALSKPFVDAIFDDVSQWDGYRFRVGKYGVQPFTKLLDATTSNFEQDLASEITRIATKLGPVLENCIKELS